MLTELVKSLFNQRTHKKHTNFYTHFQTVKFKHISRISSTCTNSDVILIFEFGDSNYKVWEDYRLDSDFLYA